MKKYRYFMQHLRARVRLRSAKILSKSPILVLFVSWKVFWDMPTCFQMFVDVFEPIKGVKNGLEQKMSFFSPNPLLKTAISWFDFSRYKPLTFWWFQCIFLTYWVTKMGNPLVPVAPTHFSHLGHPKLTLSPSAFRIGGPNYVNPGQIPLVYGIQNSHPENHPLKYRK